jgi:membrane protease YdiL (CAAX protease family)
MNSTAKDPLVSPRAALLFQGGIGVVGLGFILLFAVPVQNEGVGPGAAIIWGLVGSVATYLVIMLLSRIPGFSSDSWEAQLEKLHRFACDYSWPVLIALSILAGVGEELLFRGALQGWLVWHLNDGVAILVAAVLFGLVHYLSFTYFLIATGLGLVLGIVYWMTDSLLLVMVWHGVYDVIALYSLRRFPHLFGVQKT